jgi:hypothetical protein
MQLVNVEKSKTGTWWVNYRLSYRKSYRRNTRVCLDTKSRKGRFTINQWNASCKAWRKDLYPRGVPGKGWRAVEDEERRKSPEKGMDWGR